MSTYQDEVTQQRDIRLARETAASNDNELREFFARHRDIVDCTANRHLIIQFFGVETKLTAQILDDSIASTSLYQTLAKQTEPEDRAKLEKAIIALLKGGGSPEAVRGQQAMFRFKDIKELAAWHDRLQQEHDMRQKTPLELKAIVKGARPVQEQDLPSSISRAQILHMLSADQIRFLVSKYSMAAVTKRLNER
jgi:hypothetical protein